MAGRRTAVAGGVGVLVVTAGAASSEFLRPGSTQAYKVAGGTLVVLLLVGA